MSNSKLTVTLDDRVFSWDISSSASVALIQQLVTTLGPGKEEPTPTNQNLDIAVVDRIEPKYTKESK